MSAGKAPGLWVATTKAATAYNVADGRGFDDATDLVDANYDATLVRDGWAVYRRYEQATHQTCTAHILRRCEEMIADCPLGQRDTPPDQRHPPRRSRRQRPPGPKATSCRR